MRPSRLKPEQRAAMRAMYESGWVTMERLATTAQISVGTVASRARREGWKAASPRSGMKRANTAPWTPDQRSGSAEGIVSADLLLKAVPDWPPEDQEISLEDLRLSYGQQLSRQLANVLAQAERGVLDKARIDALISLGRVFERAEALAEQEAVKKQKRSDDELAAMLERIDDRIVELAEAYAEELVEGKCGDRMG